MRRLFRPLQFIWVAYIIGVVASLTASVIWALYTRTMPGEQDTLDFLRTFGFPLLGFPLILGVLTLLAWRDARYFIADTFDGLTKVKFARDLVLGEDIVIAEYEEHAYLRRPVHKAAEATLSNGDGVVIVGRPLSGKTRLAWALLRRQLDALVIIPRTAEPPPIEPSLGLARHDLILFFDDLHDTAETSRPLAWRDALASATRGRCRVRIVATSRDGKDWDRVEEKQRALLKKLGGESAQVFTSQVSNHEDGDLSREEGRRLAEALGLSDAEFEARFDGTPGSLVLDLIDMSKRYASLRRELPGGVAMHRLLDAAKLLHVTRQPRFPAALLAGVAAHLHGGPLSRDAWETMQRRTAEEGFGRIGEVNEFQTYRPYLVVQRENS